MIPDDTKRGKSLYLPPDVKCFAYEPAKKRQKCACGHKGEWVWQERTKHYWTRGEVLCSRCLIVEKLKDQAEKVESFIQATVLVAHEHPERMEKLAEAVDMTTDPPTLTDKGYWNLAHVVVLTHKFSNRRADA